MDQIEIRPHSDGQWSWERVRDGEAVNGQGNLPTRKEAIAEARAARRGESVRLFRLDGTLVGELDAADSNADDAQTVDIVPATEHGE